MSRMVRSAKRACLQVGHSTGLLSIVARSPWRQRRLLILCYHGISLEDEHLWDGALYMAAEDLTRRLRLLKSSGSSVLPLIEAIERLYADDLPPRSVALTFDDGYHDFVEQAFPRLAEHGFTATVYLPTLHCGRNAPVFALACSYVLWKGRGKVIRVPEIGQQTFDLRSTAGIEAAVQTVKAVAQRDRLTLSDKDLLVRHIAQAAGVDYDRISERGLLQIMGPADVRRLTDAGVDFELHTHRHRTPRDREHFREEIETNRARLQQMTGKTARHFCYPSGWYAPELPTWLDELGVVSATTCDPGLATATTTRLMLPRFVDTSSTPPAEFLAWLSGAASIVTPRRSYGVGAQAIGVPQAAEP